MDDSWLSLLSPRNQNHPRFRALCAACLSGAAEIADLLSALPSQASLDTATGAHLDLLGALLALPRPGPAVPDDDYRLYIRAKAALRRWNGTNETLPETLTSAFPDREARLIDHQDGTVTVSLSGNPPPFPLASLFPFPAGVRCITSES